MERSDYFDHDADIGIIGEGDSIEEAFCAAAKAVFSIMTNLSSVTPNESIEIEFDEEDLELALVTWLNQLLGKSKEKGLVFSQFQLNHSYSHWKGLAFGEKWRNDFERGTEVKGATLTMLSVKKNNHWHAQCVVDV